MGTVGDRMNVSREQLWLRTTSTERMQALSVGFIPLSPFTEFKMHLFHSVRVLGQKYGLFGPAITLG